jgi:hypothetical protein
MEKRETTIEYPKFSNVELIETPILYTKFNSNFESELADQFASRLAFELEKHGKNVNEKTLRNYILHAIENS